MEMTKAQRDLLVRRIEELDLDLYAPDRKIRFSDDEKRIMMREADSLRQEYDNSLPERVLSRCPWCGDPLIGRIDDYGLDGPFWNQTGGSPVSKACSHYLTFLGGLHYQGKEPTAKETGFWNEIHSGPEVPFVVPRLMSLKGMRATLSSMPIQQGDYMAYLVGYFANPPVAPEDGHQVWLRRAYYYKNQDGHVFANTRTDPWDFDIIKWLDRDPWVLGWITPGDESLHIRTGATGCPYTNLKGRRYGIVCRRGQVWGEPAPDGSSLDLFD